MARAVRNLLANATRHARSHVVTAVTTTRGGATIQVDDDGPGIPADRRLLVLERFSRLDDARTADTGGAGLGPAIARSVAEAHGGSIVVDAADLGGARFALHLPAPGA